jgi:glycosyltransferase involved in cell wall biosynthesis
LVSPLVTVIVPTHEHASTIDLAVTSVLEQEVTAIDVVIVGDGVTKDVRRAVQPLLDDPRVRFIDAPKSNSRAELIRHVVIAASAAHAVCYHGDDDLMLPGHLRLMLELLETVDLAMPAPLWIDTDGSFRAYATDIARADCRAWHAAPLRNAIGLTGVTHRRQSYLRLPHGWRVPPPGRWSDHAMWQQWFDTPGMTYATASTPTVLKFSASPRAGWTAEERRDELRGWRRRIAASGANVTAELTAAAMYAYRRDAIELRLELARAQDALATAPG